MNATTPLPLTDLDQETASALKLWVILNRAHRAISERARRSVERNQLSLSEFGVLEVLYSKGPLLVGDLGAKILLTSGSTTYVVDKLEERKLVARRPCPSDRRALYVDLTDQGRELIGQIFPEHAEALRHAMEGLTSEEKQIAGTMLKRLGRYAEES
jgi:MarR family transcriptional regulator, 2-MHQ and catechol-resistance regulon repressor